MAKLSKRINASEAGFGTLLIEAPAHLLAQGILAAGAVGTAIETAIVAVDVAYDGAKLLQEMANQSYLQIDADLAIEQTQVLSATIEKVRSSELDQAQQDSIIKELFQRHADRTGREIPEAMPEDKAEDKTEEDK